jgi:N-acetylmuramoyl-L-alanine amidase
MKNKWCFFWVLLSSFYMGLPLSVHAATTKITGIQVSTLNAVTHIVLNLSNESQPHIFSLSHPDRLVFDLKNTQLAINLRSLQLTHSGIKIIRIGYPKPCLLRLVFDLESKPHFKLISPLPAQQIRVDILPPLLPKLLKKPFIASNQENIEQVEIHPLIIMIDPGHGGKDTGAIGLAGTKEKDVVLAIAKQLSDLINQQPHMSAVLTRSGDYYITLHNRLVYARKNKADIFLSIHADSYFNNHASGASIYALSKHGATSIAARWLAKRDNYSELEGISLSGLGDQSYILRSVLIDLAQTATVTDSLHLGTALLNALDNVTMLHYSRIEQAPFMVLKSPDIPSILVETGFISNPTEELRLRDRTYQHKIALALFNGIRFYHKKYAAAGI